jgi:anti-sigma B factor antagonist
MEVAMPQTLVSSSSTVRTGDSWFPRFECTLRDGGLDAAWVRVTGELDIATAPQLAEMLGRAEERCQRVVLDLRELTLMDSAGVHVILDATLRATAAGRRLVVVRGPWNVDRVLDLAEASDTLAIVDLDSGEPPVLALLKLARRERSA